MYDLAIIGGGIVGLSTAWNLLSEYPNVSILLLEKEASWANHQTSHNSGVIHSGIYYKPGSLKAKLAREGNLAMKRFGDKYGIAYENCGKVIVAANQEEIPLLDALFQRGLENGLEIRQIDRVELREIEPYVNGVAGIFVPSTGIVNYRAVCETLVSLLRQAGADLRLHTQVESARDTSDCVEIHTNRETLRAHFLISCAGLYSDRIAKSSGMKLDMKIVPFRGEYYELKPERRYLVKNLIYPVPNPNFPFLGVHFTRMIDGRVVVGPNAVLSLKREGYTRSEWDLRDMADIFGYGGFWRLASKYWKYGLDEMIRSYSKKAFLRSIQRLMPDIQLEDLIEAPAGVRAQALESDGNLVDDFYITSEKRMIHVCNAPSPAATASLLIGREIVKRVGEQFFSEYEQRVGSL